MEEKTVWRFAIFTLIFDLVLAFIINASTVTMPGGTIDILLPSGWIIVFLIGTALVHLTLAALIFSHVRERGATPALWWSVFTLIFGFFAVLFHRMRGPLGHAWSLLRHSPSLIGVLVLEYIARTVLVVLFIMIDAMIVLAMNPDAASILATQPGSIGPLLNAPTIAVVVLVVIIELLILLYASSFFISGFYGMAKNTIKDGSARFGEFIPSVKRYWRVFFRFYFLKYGLTILLFIPAIIMTAVLLASPQGATDTMVYLSFAIALLFSVIATVVLHVWLFYGEAVIIFADAEALPAAKQSGKVLAANIGSSVTTMLTVLSIAFIATIITAILLSPFDYMIKDSFLVGNSSRMMLWQSIRQVADLVFGIIMISATALWSLFVLIQYNAFVGGRPAASPVLKARTSVVPTLESSASKTVIKRKPIPAKPTHKPAHKKR
ncbi:TPA: hypothetical protein HA251_08160 [Candidatus Woesearchaeota archaeon]|nr:hypothetical protein [Candidatus Woesearchaeota archaeon]